MIKKYRILWELCGSFLWCVLTLFTDRLFFTYTWWNPRFFVYKGLFFLLAFVILHAAVTFTKKIRERDEMVLRWLKWTVPYLVISLIILVIVWPGYWAYDNIWILDAARALSVSPWYHFLTGAVTALGMMLIPIPGGVVLLQNLVISGIVGGFLCAAETLALARLYRPVSSAWFVILYLPFLLPPVLLHNQHPYRPTWVTWMEFFVMFLMVWWYFRGTTIRKPSLAVLAILGGVMASWRTENIYYAVAIPALLLFLLHKKLLTKFAWCATTVGIVVSMMLCNAYNESLSPGTSWQYQRLALCYQAVALVQDANQEADAEALAMIDPVISVEACRANSSLHGSDLRDAVMRPVEDLTEQDWNECVEGIVQLALKYPKSLLRERMGIFLQTVGIRTEGSAQKVIFYGPLVLYELEEPLDAQENFLYHTVASWPICASLRVSFTHLMEGEISPLRGVISLSWQMLPSFALLATAVLVLLIRRKWFLFLVAGALFVKIPLIFLTAPDSHFMYYLSPYLAGYTAAAAGIVYAILLKTRRKQCEISER